MCCPPPFDLLPHVIVYQLEVRRRREVSTARLDRSSKPPTRPFLSLTHFVVCQQNTDDEHYITSRFCPLLSTICTALYLTGRSSFHFCILCCIIIVASILSFPPYRTKSAALISSFPSFLPSFLRRRRRRCRRRLLVSHPRANAFK